MVTKPAVATRLPCGNARSLSAVTSFSFDSCLRSSSKGWERKVSPSDA